MITALIKNELTSLEIVGCLEDVCNFWSICCPDRVTYGTFSSVRCVI